MSIEDNNKVAKILDDISSLGRDLKSVGVKLPPNLVGMYGEFVVWNELEKTFKSKGYEINFSSGQSNADIQLIKNSKVINIEVKTSRYKEEWYGEGYGFAINIKKCREHPDVVFNHPSRGELKGDFCYFDYLVAVLISDSLSAFKLYVFPRSYLLENEKSLRNRNKRFKSSTHRLVFIEKPRVTDEITDFDRRFVKEKDRFRDKWELIK